MQKLWQTMLSTERVKLDYTPVPFLPVTTVYPLVRQQVKRIAAKM